MSRSSEVVSRRSGVGWGLTAVARIVALLALVMTGLLMLSTSPASALVTRQLQTEITGTCPATGNCPTAERIPFASPTGLTVDSSNRLWVADPGKHTVDRFSAIGAYEAQNEGTGSWGGSTQVESLAFSAAVAEVFAADSANEGHLFGLEPTSATFSGKNLALALGGQIHIAADNSAGATGGDLYVSNGTRVIRVKASDGAADDFTAGPGVGTNEITAPFEQAQALAVAPNGNFYVSGDASERGNVYKFDSSGAFLEEFHEVEGAVFGHVLALAVDPTTGNLLVAENLGNLYEFSPTGGYERRISKPAGAPFHGVKDLAVDSSGTTYVSEEAGKLVDVFSPLIVLPDVTTLPAEVHSVTEAILHGEVNPAGREVTECFFEYGLTTTYGQTAECALDAAAIGAGTAPVPVEAQLTGLTAGATYHYRLVAANANGANIESGDLTFFTGASIDATSASAVTATSVTLETEIDPHGTSTSYHFEYDTTPYAEGAPAHGVQVPFPDGPVGAAEADVLRTAQIQGLQPLTTYFFRVVATNSFGTVVGPERSFTTQGAAASLLLDDRGWEQVSPPNKQGIPLESIPAEGGDIQAAADGSAITYIAKGSIVTDPAGDRSTVNSQDLSRRGPSGWTTQDITTPHQAPVGVAPGFPSEYELFSSDLSLGAVGPLGATPLSPQAGERTPYLRGPGGTYDPLVNPANVPAGTHFGGEEIEPEEWLNGVTYSTGSPDLGHILLSSPQALTPGFVAAGTGNYVYEWSGGSLQLASQLPAGPSETLCGGSASACVPEPAGVGHQSRQVRNAISTDGSRVVLQGRGNSLYVRDLVRGETLELDAPAPGAGGSAGGASYQDASTDGSSVFFTSAEKLTGGSTAEPDQPDLYMCQVSVEAGHLACALKDLSVDHNPGESANVLGAVIGASEDGSEVYFVANGALAAGAVHGGCTGARLSTQSCNLYDVDTLTGATKLVAVLSGSDYPDWNASENEDLNQMTARVSPNGRYLAFMSQRPLTGYDNRDAKSGARDQEVYLYDASAAGGAGSLICASCNPTGARPHGVFDRNVFPGLLIDRAGGNGTLWPEQTLAANVPGWTPVDNLHALYQSRYLSDSGRLFFNAADALVPQDSNGVMDVYEYEPRGVGSCTTSSATFGSASGGCVSLISSGTSPEESAFMDASEDGDDVFFLTASKLAPTDVDNALDLYDARVGGSAAVPAKPVECAGDGCQQPAVPPVHPTPGTALLNGPGNLLQCPKGKVAKKGKCVKKQQKKSKKKHHNKKTKQHKKSAHQKSNERKGTKQKRATGHDGGGHK